MTGHTVVYGCLCADAADVREDVPQTCPGHDRPIVGEHANRLPGPVQHGHDCPTWRTCPNPPRPHDPEETR